MLAVAIERHKSCTGLVWSWSFLKLLKLVLFQLVLCQYLHSYDASASFLSLLQQ